MPFLNSFIDLPSERAISGSLLPPNITSTITRMTSSSCVPRPNMVLSSPSCLCVRLSGGWPERDARGSGLYRSFAYASAVGGLRETHGAPLVGDTEPNVRDGQASGGARETAGRARRGGAGLRSEDGKNTTSSGSSSAGGSAATAGVPSQTRARILSASPPAYRAAVHGGSGTGAAGRSGAGGGAGSGGAA